MPEDNPKGGERVLKTIKEIDLKHNRTTPVILATAWGYNGPAQDASAIYPAAIKTVLTKAFSLRDLNNALIAACGVFPTSGSD